MSRIEPAAELAFVRACCRWPDDDARRLAIDRSAGDVRDWDEVARLAAVHRIEGLVAQGAVLAGRSSTFGATAERVKLRALDDLGETLRLSRSLGQAQIRHAILKGVPLGVRAYGSPTLKQSWDIDLLVAPDEAVAAADALVRLGYQPRVPARPFTSDEFRRWSAVSKEAEFRLPSGRTVELHWGVSDHPMLLRPVGVADAGCSVDLLIGAPVPTLGDSANLAYLAVHGAYHGWSRLKWLADFAAFLTARPVDDRRQLIESAASHGVGRALDQALILSEQLLGAEVGVVVESGEARDLAALAIVAIERRGRADDLDKDSEGTRAIRAIRRRLVPGIRYRLVLGYRRLKGSEDRRLIPLPPRLAWGYWAIRPFSAIYRTVLRRAHSRRNGVCHRA